MIAIGIRDHHRPDSRTGAGLGGLDPETPQMRGKLLDIIHRERA
jgi:hypothetical protein